MSHHLKLAVRRLMANSFSASEIGQPGAAREDPLDSCLNTWTMEYLSVPITRIVIVA